MQYFEVLTYAIILSYWQYFTPNSPTVSWDSFRWYFRYFKDRCSYGWTMVGSLTDDFLYFHYNPRLQCSNNMCASVSQHIFTALALQLHCSSDKDNKYMLDIFSLQFFRLQLEMKSIFKAFPPLPIIWVPRHLHISTFTHHDF